MPNEKVIAVVFSKNSGARILVNPKNLSELRKQPNVIIDPDLTEVRALKLPPHKWTIHPVTGKVVPNHGTLTMLEHALVERAQRMRERDLKNAIWFMVGAAALVGALLIFGGN